MEKILGCLMKYREQIAYMICGCLTTVVNIGAYALCAQVGMPTGISNAIAWVLAVLAAYVTNRIWVFHSPNHGSAMLRELGAFVSCRAATGVMDEAIMILGVDFLGPIVAPGHLRAWGIAVKLFSNALVIILNYVFSKRFIFKPKGRKAEESPAE